MPDPIERPQSVLELLAEVDAFDADLFPVNAPFDAETDKVIGELSPWARKLYALGRYSNRQANVISAEREYHSVEDYQNDQELCELRYRANLLNELMYFVVRSELKAFGTPCVGVREGWQVVSTDPDDDQDGFEGFLRSIVKRRKKG